MASEVEEISISIFRDLLSAITREITADAVLTEQNLRRRYGPAQSIKELRSSEEDGNGNGNGNSVTKKVTKAPGLSSVSARLVYNTTDTTRDVYGNETPSEAVYFACLNCGRKVAGGRYAAHIDRCLGGRNTRRAG